VPWAGAYPIGADPNASVELTHFVSLVRFLAYADPCQQNGNGASVARV